MQASFSQSSRQKLMKDRDLLPPLSESPFGPFPEGWNAPGNSGGSKMKVTGGTVAASSTATTRRQQGEGAATQSTAAPRDILVAHTGFGGMTVSTFKGSGAAKAAESNGRFGPPGGAGKAGAFSKRRIPPTDFRHHYERGDLPLSIQHAAARTLLWKVDVAKLDYHHYLPLFFDGLRELEEPFNFVALQGSLDLLERGGAKILPTVPQLIIPLKKALNTRHPEVLIKTFRVIQKLVVSGDYVGEALVPYYRQLLPVFNLFKNQTKNTGGRMEFGQRNKTDLSGLINETLNLMETYGGPDAFINIKYMVPTYESCM